MIDYKFDEDDYLYEIESYINKTYQEHYGDGKIQTTEVIIDRGRGLDFCLGNIDKYSNRYGHKGGPDDHRKDLLKIIHYGILALYAHDKKCGTEEPEESPPVSPRFSPSWEEFDELKTIHLGDMSNYYEE